MDTPTSRSRFRRLILAFGALGLGLAGLILWRSLQAPKTPAGGRRHFLLVVGMDGGEWQVIEKLWGQGKLPHLKAIAERGTKATLRTAYNSSPVIWTTIATGVVPAVHGITDFVVPTDRGDVPISSAVRKVPALWNMLTRVGRQVAVLGWWGSWPAEPVRGVVVSDRVLLGLGDSVSPASFRPRFDTILKRAVQRPEGFDVADRPERQDLALARTAEDLADEGYDLILLYFRTTDIVSHQHWAEFEPTAFPGRPSPQANGPDPVSRIYEAVDAAIGRLLAAAPRDTNVIVLSDHGFHATRGGEELHIELDMDKVLERLGYLTRKGGAVDFARSQAYTYATPPHRRPKLLKLNAKGPGGEELRRRLRADLEAVRYASGAAAFWVREPRPKEAEQGVDLVAVVSPEGITPTLSMGGQASEPLLAIHRLSGTHTNNTHGIFLAAGPDIARGADVSGIHVHDIAPTLLYALGLPVAEDFAGHVQTALFTQEFQRRAPLRTLRTWGVRKGESAVRSSPADEKLLKELRSLGYLQ